MGKEHIFWEFCKLDFEHKNTVSRARFAQTLAASLPDGLHSCLPELMKGWDIPEPVEYVKFLHRFQIVSELSSSRAATHLNVFRAMERLQISIIDVHATQLLRQIDRDMNGSVDAVEFHQFLLDCNIDIPKWQATTIYETLLLSLNRGPNVEDVLTALALVGNSPEKD